MPIYEFQCTKCRHLFEEFFAKLPERPTAKCPECGGKGKKIISNVGIVFKGAGFYVTDSRTSPAKGSSSASSSATTSNPESAPSPETPSASESSSGESKSEPKSDTGGDKKGKSKSGDSGKSSDS